VFTCGCAAMNGSVAPDRAIYQAASKRGSCTMGRKGWLVIIAAFGGTLILVVIAIEYAMRLSGLHSESLSAPVAVVQGSPPKHGLLGIDFDPSVSPLTIGNVLKGGAASEAGLQLGDAIIAIGSARNPDAASLLNVIQATAPGDELLVKVIRGQHEVEVRVRLNSFAEIIALQARERQEKATP